MPYDVAREQRALDDLAALYGHPLMIDAEDEDDPGTQYGLMDEDDILVTAPSRLDVVFLAEGIARMLREARRQFGG